MRISTISQQFQMICNSIYLRHRGNVMKNYLGIIMQNKAKILGVTLLFGLPIMIGFQNCSKINSVQMEDMTFNKAAAIDTDQLQAGEEVAFDENNNPIPPEMVPDAPSEESAQMPSSIPSEMPESGEVPPSSNEMPAPGSEEVANMPAPEPSSGSGEESASGMPAPAPDNGIISNPGEAGQEVGYQVRDREMERQDDIDEALADCESEKESNNASGAGSLSEDGLSLSGIAGNKVISPADFNGNPNVKSISHGHGKIVVCNLNVESISSTAGKIILINSKVGSIVEHVGNIDVVDSQALVSDSKAKIFKASAGRR